jgi:CHAD domain-containing protein
MIEEVRSVPDRAGPAHLLVASALTGFRQRMDDNLPGVLADADPAHLHDVRVAVRRTRAALKLSRPGLPESLYGRWEPEFRWLGGLTGPVRDLDVLRQRLVTLREQLVVSDAVDLRTLDAQLQRRRWAEGETLKAGLQSTRFSRLHAEWGETLAELAAAPPGGWEGQLTAGELADLSITKAARRVRRSGMEIAADAPAADLHRLRRRCRDLRYALVVFRPVLETKPRKRAIADLKALQDALGRVQDVEVQRSTLRALADEAVPAQGEVGPALAVGELIGLLDGAEAQARDEFATRFERFSRKGSRRGLRRLGGKS